MRRPLYLPRRHAGHALHPVWPVAGYEPPHGLKARSAVIDEITIDEPMLNCNVQEPIRQRAVGSGSELEMQRGKLGGVGPARVDYDEGAPGFALSFLQPWSMSAAMKSQHKKLAALR